MKVVRFSLLAVLFLMMASFCTNASVLKAGEEVPKGFTPLFNGKDLTGWKGLVGNPKTRAEMSAEELATAQVEADKLMNAHWSVVDGEIVFDGKGKSLCTIKDYGDFEMYVDWKIMPLGDSGIYVRGCPQIQIWDPTNEKYFKHGAEKGSGAPWNNKIHSNMPLVKADNPIGEWNTMYIRLVGEKLTVKLNGMLVVDNVVMENYWERDKPLYKTGQIELQNHGNTLWFDNIYVREIPIEEANEILSDIAGCGFESVFNGKDFTGWQGETQNYEVVDGNIVCKKGKGGTVFTNKEYEDFEVHLEFKLPEAGNNGLALRYPGEGNAHIAGMTEIQILDSEHPKYAELDPRQYHGSAYGMAAAHRGFLREVGEWNFQKVTVKGSTIKVELNGFTIMDTDMSKITESKNGEPYNKGVAKGHFGFAGHNDPVPFRKIKIKELN